MRNTLSWLAVLAVAALGADLFAQSLTETAGGQRIIDASNYSFRSTFYAPAGTPSPNGAEYFMYVQADENLDDGLATLDSVLLYKNPYTWAGLTGSFSRVTQILPGDTQPTNYYYGHPAVFQDSGKYFLTAHKSLTDHDFDQLLWGVSTDGQNYSWHELIRYVGPDDEYSDTLNEDSRSWGRTLRIPGATIRGPVMIAGQEYYWGFIDVITRGAVDHCLNNPDGSPTGTCSGTGAGDGIQDDPDNPNLPQQDGIGAILIKVDRSNLRGYSNVFLWSGGAWKQTGPNGEFDQSMIPDVLWHFRDKPRLHRLNDRWELWANTGKPPQCTIDSEGCGLGNGQAQFDNAIVYWPVTPPATLTQPPVGGPEYDIYSDIRCMPSPLMNNRGYPFRLEGTNLLYSTSSNPFCSTTFEGFGVVVTAVQ